MRNSLTGGPDRYNSPEIKVFSLKLAHVMCAVSGGDGVAPGGYDWEDWTTTEE